MRRLAEQGSEQQLSCGPDHLDRGRPSDHCLDRAGALRFRPVHEPRIPPRPQGDLMNAARPPSRLSAADESARVWPGSPSMGRRAWTSGRQRRRRGLFRSSCSPHHRRQASDRRGDRQRVWRRTGCRILGRLTRHGGATAHILIAARPAFKLETLTGNIRFSTRPGRPSRQDAGIRLAVR